MVVDTSRPKKSNLHALMERDMDMDVDMRPGGKRKASFDDPSATDADLLTPLPPDSAATDARGYPRKRVALACEVCRLRKTRCDAERPACSFCKKLDIECVYRGPSKSDRPRVDSGDDGTALRLNKIEASLETITCMLEQQQQTQHRHPQPPPQPHQGAKLKPNTPVSHHSEVSITSPASVVSVATTPKATLIPHMPNVFAFRGPEPWCYDCTEDFYANQLHGIIDMRSVYDDPEIDLSRPNLWRLQQSFVENVLKWLPLFDHDTALKHLHAAQACKYSVESPSLCLVFLINAIGSLAMDTGLYTESFHDMPGSSYYIRAFEIMKNFPPLSTDLCILQCRTLEAMYLLYAMRPLESWKAIAQASQNCIFLLKAGLVDQGDPAYRDAFDRIYWICYIIDSELEICLELPPSGLRGYENAVSLPSSHYEEEGMYYLLALSSLRKLMVEVVISVGLKGSAFATYAPVVVMELRNQIDNWYRHLPSALQFPSDHSLLFDKRRAYLRCQYNALIVVVFWPFVARSQEHLATGKTYHEEVEADRIRRGAHECLTACRNFLKGTDDILTQKTIDSHVIVRSYFTLTVVLLLMFPGVDSDIPEAMEDRLLLEYALDNLAPWKVVPFLRKPLAELERMATLKGLNVPA